jgi:hypothetical protein
MDMGSIPLATPLDVIVNYNFLKQTNQPVVLTEAAAINTVIPKRCRWFHGFFADYFGQDFKRRNRFARSDFIGFFKAWVGA